MKLIKELLNIQEDDDDLEKMLANTRAVSNADEIWAALEELQYDIHDLVSKGVLPEEGEIWVESRELSIEAMFQVAFTKNAVLLYGGEHDDFRQNSALPLLIKYGKTPAETAKNIYKSISEFMKEEERLQFE